MGDALWTELRAVAAGLRGQVEFLEDAAVRVLPEFDAAAPAKHRAALEVIKATHGAHFIGWLSRWADSGFPQIEMSGGLAASLMATSMGKTAAVNLHVPWDAFMIRIPAGMLRARPEPGRAVEDMEWLHILRWPSGLFSLFASGQVGMWNAGMRTLEEIGEEELAELESDGGPFHHELDETDERALGLLDRLFLGACAELSTPKAEEAIQRHRVTVPARLRQGDPKAWIYTVRRYVKVDCRYAIRSYVEGTSKRAPTVQTLVRGHWRRVRHGDAGALVKWVPIDPYWRGPEEAPIVTRAHVVTAAANETKD